MIDYSEYFKLTPYQRQCLPATNFWRMHKGKHPIAIPPDEDTPLICGTQTRQGEVITITKIVEKTAYMDFAEVEKPVLREKRRRFIIMEFLEMGG